MGRYYAPYMNGSPGDTQRMAAVLAEFHGGSQARLFHNGLHRKIHNLESGYGKRKTAP